MKYYYNSQLKSTIEARDDVPITSMGYIQISEDQLKALGGTPSQRKAPVEVEAILEPVEEEVSIQDEDADDLFDDIFSSLSNGSSSEDENTSTVIKLDESVLAQEEKAASNTFDSIKDLRAYADKESEARVVKGKAHGVYSYDAEAEAWKRIGDL